MFGRIVTIGILASALVFAQRGGGGGGRGGGGGDMGPSGSFGGGAASKLDRLAETLKLDKDQKKDIKTAMDDAQKEALPVKEQLSKSRLAVAEAVAANKPKEDLDKACLAVGELETQMNTIELKTFAKMAGLLQDDQKKQNGVTLLFLMTKDAFLGKNWNSDQ
ncbi:MAG: hypothetical protein ABI759_30795 [Candidatus Solibacter sp.]